MCEDLRLQANKVNDTATEAAYHLNWTTLLASIYMYCITTTV